MTESESDYVWETLISASTQSFRERGPTVPALVHYTSFPTLQGIITNNEVWFSPVMGMNDYNEVAAGRELLVTLSANDGPLSDVFGKIREFDEQLLSEFNTEFQRTAESDLFDTFVSCWSECDPKLRTHDNLTMWRGYAVDGNGVAVVIDPIKLGLNEEFTSEIIICPVYYESESEFADRANARFSRFLDDLGKLERDVIDRNRPYVVNAFVELCFHLAITHKHPGFKAEREWRFVWRRHRNGDDSLLELVQSKATPRGMFEYFCLPLEPNPSLGPSTFDVRELITEIMIGPTDDAYLKRRAVERILTQKGFNRETTAITQSLIPYRSFG